MSDQPTRQGAVGTVAAGAIQVAQGLPPAFLGLLVINAIFILSLFWFLHSENEARAMLLARVIDSCLTIESSKR